MNIRLIGSNINSHYKIDSANICDLTSLNLNQAQCHFPYVSLKCHQGYGTSVTF